MSFKFDILWVRHPTKILVKIPMKLTVNEKSLEISDILDFYKIYQSVNFIYIARNFISHTELIRFFSNLFEDSEYQVESSKTMTYHEHQFKDE